MEDVLDCYRWRAEWTYGALTFKSYNWDTTNASLTALKTRICESLEAGDPDDLLNSCAAVLKWGGDRTGGQAGAFLFLRQLQGQLPEYLLRTKDILSLNNVTFDRLDEILCMNAMMTKVHSLVADDGLPIYDSRVAGAVAALVELYRRTTDQKWTSLPDDLHFPSTDRRRTARSFADDALSPQHIYYNQSDSPMRWAKAKIKLGRVMRHSLTVNPRLFGSAPNQERMHALEATLFMIGYDLRCLHLNLRP